MTELKLKTFEKDLYGCRFCPMCKPACEIGNLTKQEQYTTKGKALILWRIAAGHDSFNKRDGEIVFQSTLDTVSQAWCIHDYPVGQYNLAARRELVRDGELPEAVENVLGALPSPTDPPKSESVFLSELPIDSFDMIPFAEEKPELWVTSTGRIPYVLGDVDSALEMAREFVEKLNKGGVKKLIVEGSFLLYTLKVIFKELGIEIPNKLEIVSLEETIEEGISSGSLEPTVTAGRRCFVHDSRAAFFLAEELPDDSVLQPANSDTEAGSGKGEIYDRPRRIVDAAGLERIESVWSRAMSRSSGADDGLNLTYPALAEGLARERIEQAQSVGAEMIVCESYSDFVMFKAVHDPKDPEIFWLPYLFSVKG